MDTKIRSNENCIIGLPRCGFAFSSARSCFIGYGFSESTLETKILRKLLEERQILPEEAGSSFQPAKMAFCSKICSKIITSQFCIILLNSERQNGVEYANANVMMEYGLMLGFNKYVIPFQRLADKLPFNVSGLDTLKYDNESFEEKAVKAIDGAIAATSPPPLKKQETGEMVLSYLYTKERCLASLMQEGERDIYAIGEPLGFSLLISFSGMSYTYFANFSHLRSQEAFWRASVLSKAIGGRLDSVAERAKLGVVGPEVLAIVGKLKAELDIWVILATEQAKSDFLLFVKEAGTPFRAQVMTLDQIETEMRNMGGFE